MSAVSQLIIKIIQYASLIGIFAFGAAVLSIADMRKKIICFFLIFISTVIVSFVFYTGTMFFIAAFQILFVFLLINQLVNQLYLIKVNTGRSKGEIQNPTINIRTKVLNIVLPISICGIIGYLFYHYLNSNNFTGEKIQEVPLIGTGQLAEYIFGHYGILIIILFSALFVSFVWFTIILGSGGKMNSGKKNETVVRNDQ